MSALFANSPKLAVSSPAHTQKAVRQFASAYIDARTGELTGAILATSQFAAAEVP